MIINRKWAMPNNKTFSILPISHLIEKYHKGNSIDPFANTSRIARITNDLNPDYKCNYSMDALLFLEMFENNSIDFVFYDPPYSLRQVSECYKNVGIKVTQETTRSDWFTKHKREIKRVLKSAGIVMCFGWNSNGIGGQEMEMLELLAVAHGGSHNDTLITVERKIQLTLGLEI